MHKSYTVSVVIVNYNGEPYIQKCVDSFLTQSIKPQEILVFDNNSSDRSLEIIRDAFPDVSVTAFKENRGYAYCLNRGIERSTGDIIVLSNNDLYLESSWLEETLKVFDHYDTCGLVASKVRYMDEPEKINSVGILFYNDIQAVNKGLDEIDTGQYDTPGECYGAYGAIMTFRRKVFDQIGLFDEGYFLFREEDDIMWRMHLTGWQARFTPWAVAYHKRSANTRLFSPLKLYYSERNRIWNIAKYLPLRCLITMLPYTIVRYWSNWRLVKNQTGTKKSIALQKSSKGLIFRTIIKAWLHALCGLHRELPKRFAFNQKSRKSYSHCLKLVRTYRATLEDVIK